MSRPWVISLLIAYLVGMVTALTFFKPWPYYPEIVPFPERKGNSGLTLVVILHLLAVLLIYLMMSMEV